MTSVNRHDPADGAVTCADTRAVPAAEDALDVGAGVPGGTSPAPAHVRTAHVPAPRTNAAATANH